LRAVFCTWFVCAQKLELIKGGKSFLNIHLNRKE